MAERDRPHLRLSAAPQTEDYRPHPRDMSGAGGSRPEVDRASHGRQLRAGVEDAITDADTRRQQADEDVGLSADGIYLTFESFPEVQLALASLEPRRGKVHPVLLSVRAVQNADGEIVELATVFFPDGTVDTFIAKLNKYVDEDTRSGKPLNQALVEAIAQIQLATVEQLWTETTLEFPPEDEAYWWEVWLRQASDGGEIDRLTTFAESVDASVGRQVLRIEDRTVVTVNATARQLASSLAVLSELAELRAARAPTDFFEDEPPASQAAWIDDLVERTSFADPETCPRVCVLDTGLNSGHPLLAPAASADEQYAYNVEWGNHDHHGHGTEMGGIALFGDRLADYLAGTHSIDVPHRLESVKILPPNGINPADLYGAITASAAALVEIDRPDVPRAFSMAVTAERLERDDAGDEETFGQPTSWSAVVDALSFGRQVIDDEAGLTFLEDAEKDAARLFVVSAGNVREHVVGEDHLDRSDVEPVEDPAQAWNALTVGAFTDRVDTSPLDDHEPVAESGELSPHSRTSLVFDRRSWPVKPDVVLEGGNLAQSADGGVDRAANLEVLTTNGSPGHPTRLLTVSNGTSAATAAAARMAALAWDVYPDLWPETVRGLVVHAARWTPKMLSHIEQARTPRRGGEIVARRYGMGVPTSERVLQSASNDLTLVWQGEISPFAQGSMAEVHFHDLPWPTDELQTLQDTPVRMRVTLSYFVEPNPSRRGWRGRYRYQSHGLRFAVRRPTESDLDFHKRLNKLALAPDERKPKGATDAPEWMLGEKVRDSGSIHSDIWSGTAADLAARGGVAVYPVSGWWKDVVSRDRSEEGARYALLVSIEAPEVEIDLWTPIANQLAIPITIDT
ncbi:S8 family peptidase [Nitriliruptoraceae bacterium ZYF776]|nr:S8 family peptidase [Profundirhabdus halotolerans]